MHVLHCVEFCGGKVPVDFAVLIQNYFTLIVSPSAYEAALRI